MYIFFSSMLLLFLLMALVCFYHLFFWNGGLAETLGLRAWLSSFECGFSSNRVNECYFSYTYFVLLVFFVVFDLEVSLLLNVPFGLCFFVNPGFYLSFLLVLAVGYSTELYSGYVRWSY